MRQFDVFVFEENGPQFEQWNPPFEDPALGWFHNSDWNRPLQKIDAEWVVFAHPAVTIDREFLNNLAQVIEGFPMVDAFAPRVRPSQQNDNAQNAVGKFFGGMLLNGSKGFASISENEKMRFVAASNPLIGVYSSRIIQRTGLFDLELPPEFRLLDYTLRMAHAGGKMFNVPYLVTGIQNKNGIEQVCSGEFLKKNNAVKPLWEIYYKSLPAASLTGFTLRHPTMIPKFLGLDKRGKARDFKRDKATSLSKLSEQYLKEISL